MDFKLNKIYVYIRGGLGNQLFQYAKAINFKQKYGGNIIALRDFHNPLNTRRPFILKELNIDIKYSYFENLKIKFLSNFLRNMQVINEEKNFSYSEIKIQKKNILLNGYWQTYKSAMSSLSHIKNSIFLNISLTPGYQKYLNDIKNTNSLSIHIRRGDYVTNVFANKFHGLLPKDFFFQGISLIKKKYPNIKIFFFSDDIEWCKNNFSEFDATYISSENINKSDLIELYLMSHCKNFIISNSSFSWWGAMLSDHDSKIVVAPKNWLSTPIDISDLLPNNWIKL